MSVGQVSINIYATKKQATSMKDAGDFVNQARYDAEVGGQYMPSATDKQLAEAFGKLTPENADKLKSAQEYLAAAAWLTDRPSLAEVLLERGELHRMDLGKLIGESLVVGSTRGLGINGLWADTAIRLGYLSKDVATAYLKNIPADEKHLVVADEMVSKGELTGRQDQQVRDALRDRIQRKARASTSAS